MTKISELREGAMDRAGGRCEFPGCEIDRPKLEMAHLHGKGMGGSKYRDVIDNVVIFCKWHHDWLDGRLIPNGRRFENEQIVRHALDRRWKERR